jgi:hypothetical protein
MHLLERFLPVIELGLTLLDILLNGVYIGVYYLHLYLFVLELAVAVFDQEKLDFFHLLEAFHDLEEIGELLFLLGVFSLTEAVGYHDCLLFVREDLSLLHHLLFFLFVQGVNRGLREHFVGTLRVDRELEPHSSGNFIDKIESDQLGI